MKKMFLGIILLLSFLMIFVVADRTYANGNSVTESTYSANSQQSPALPNLENDVLPSISASAVQMYPGTNIEMKQGDIIHNPKSTSTYFVGHMAIVGPDLQLRHAHPDGPRISDSLSNYITRFAAGDKFTILRYPDPSIAAAAAAWSYNNINKVTTYSVATQLHYIPTNYCSKFVWQAYYYGAHRELVSNAPYSEILTPPGMVFVYPSDILRSPLLVTKGTFYK